MANEPVTCVTPMAAPPVPIDGTDGSLGPARVPMEKCALSPCVYEG